MGPEPRLMTLGHGHLLTWCNPASCAVTATAGVQVRPLPQEDAQDTREAACLMLAWPRGLLSSWPVSCILWSRLCWGRGHHPKESCFQLRAAAELTSQVLILLCPRWFGLWVGGASSAGWVEPGLGPVLALPCSAAVLAFCGGKEQERGVC